MCLSCLNANVVSARNREDLSVWNICNLDYVKKKRPEKSEENTNILNITNVDKLVSYM